MIAFAGLRTVTARIAFVAATIALAALSRPAAAETTVERVVSPGGIVAWLVSDDAVPLIAVDFAFKGGAASDPTGKAGLSTLTAGLLDEGAGDMDDVAFKRRLDDLAVRLSFGAGRDEIDGSLATLADRKEEAFDLLAAALASPRFDEEPFARLRSQLITRRRARTTDPDTIASRLLSEATFPGHPYGDPTDGSEESLAALSRQDVIERHAKGLARDNLIVGVVGAISAEDLGPLLDRAFGGLPATSERVEVPEAQPQFGQSLSADVAEPQTVIRVVTGGIPRQDPDFMAAYLLDHILGGGSFSSRLYKEVRESRGLAYSVGTSLVNYDHASLFVAATSVRPDATDEALGLIRAAFADLAENGPTEAEVASAKRYLVGNYALRFDTSSKIAGQLVALQIEGLPIDYFARRNALVEAVTMEAMKRVARRLLGGPVTTVVVGPSSS